MLDLFGDRPVTFVKSVDLAQDLQQASVSNATLAHAVEDWLSYFGVARGVRTGDFGKLGHTMQVRPGDKGGVFRDLTNVGVGVSQVLPIVVSSLLAPRSSVLIFEQPELHLHPKVQARLGDFFLSMALLGKQCIVETHSEYILERLRRRVAEAPGSSLQPLIKIYFVELIDGESRCREIDVTAYGALGEYPNDFFDQSEREAAEILAASQRKRRAAQQAS